MKVKKVTVENGVVVTESNESNPWKYHYWACGGKCSMQGYTTLKEARWDARANGQMVVDENGNVVLDYRD